MERTNITKRARLLRMQFLERIASVADVRIDEVEAFDVAVARPVETSAD
jgi:hypothetical protein